MKSKTMILLALAIGCGLIASYMTSRLLAEREANQQAEVEKEKILIAKKDLNYGTQLKNPEEFFEQREFPVDQVPRKAIKSFDEVKNRWIFKTVKADTHITPDDLANKDHDPFVGMPHGTRAMSIRVDAQTGVSGFIQPGSRVDVLCTVRRSDHDSYTVTILQNVRVIAIDTTTTREEGQIAKTASTVTLALRPEEAQKLSLAASMGELRLILRPPGDESAVLARKTVTDDVTRGGPSGTLNFGGSELSANHEGASKSSGGTSSALAGLPSRFPAGPESESDAPPPPVPTHVLTIYNGGIPTKALYFEKDGQLEMEIKRSPVNHEPAATPAKKNKDADTDSANHKELKPKSVSSQGQAETVDGK